MSILTIPAAPVGAGVDAEVKRLKALVQLVEAEGLVLTVGTRIGTLTETPAAPSSCASACPVSA